MNATAKPATSAAGVGVLQNEHVGSMWILNAIAHHFGNEGVAKVSDAITKARAGGVPWLSILSTLLPLILSLFSGGSVNLAAIISAILALLNPTPPTPAPAGS